MKLTVGSIGYKNHAKTIIDLFNKSNKAVIKKIFYPNKVIAGDKFTNKFSDLLNQDIILILSPNHTHYKYLNMLNNKYKGYIFCEKPIASSLAELKKIKNNPKKTYINFNFIHSQTYELISKIIENCEIGEIYNGYISASHSFATKKKYKKSWRSKKKLNQLGILENVGIHYVNLFHNLYGESINMRHTIQNSLETGTAADTTNILLKINKKFTVYIFLSYASAYDFQIKLIGSKGIFEIIGNKANLYKGNNFINKNGRLCKAPISKSWLINPESNYFNSLKKSIDYFLSYCSKNKSLPKIHFEDSIKTNKIIHLSKEINF